MKKMSVVFGWLLGRFIAAILLVVSFAFSVSSLFAASDVDFVALMRELDPDKEHWSMTTKYPGRYSNSDINNVVDGNKNTDWQTGSGDKAQYMTDAFVYSISPEWNSAASFVPKSYALEFTQQYSPLSIELYGSNVVTKAWDKLHVCTIEDGLSNVTLGGEFENTMHYRTYRIDVLKTRASQGNYFYFAEFSIKGDYLTTENFMVSASPVECGEVEPGYGNNSGLEVGQSIPCRASSEWIKADETLRAVCKGYTLSNIVYNADGIFESFTHERTVANVNQFTYTHPENAGTLLTWLWECYPRVNLISADDAAGAVEVTVDGRVIEPGEYIKDGSTIHVKAIPNEGFHFVGWDGVLADDAFRAEAEFDAVLAVKHFDAQAQFLPNDDKGLVLYVSPTGNDNHAGLTKGLPKATIENAYSTVVTAMDAAGEGYRGEIRVFPGDYTMQGRELVIDKPVTITGYEGAREEIVLHAKTDKNTTHGRHFVITGDAVIANLTMADGYLKEGNLDSVDQYDSNGGSIKMSSGLVTNCVVRDSECYYYGGGIYLEGNPDCPPKVVDCLFRNCAAARHGPKGWAVAFRGGTDATTAEKPVAAVVERCRILDSKTTWYAYSAVYMDLNGAILRDTEISGVNWGTRNDYNYAFTGGGLYLSKGLVDRCIITNCVRETDAVCPQKGGGVFMKGGILHNCLIAGNDALELGGGVYAENGTLINNTIADNYTVNADSAGLYINGSSVVVVNNILAHNQQNGASAINNVAFGGLNTCSYFDYNLLSPESALDGTHVNASKLGANNQFTTSFFENHEIKPYSYKLSAASPAIDAAATIEQLRETGKLNSVFSSIPFLNLESNADISGKLNSRPLQGLASSGTALPDVGCYEANDYRNQPLSCSFTQDRISGVIEIPLDKRDGSKEAGAELENAYVPVTFTAGLNCGGTTAESAANGSFKYRWTIYDSDGAAVYTSDLIANANTFTHRFGFGEFDVELYAEHVSESAKKASYRLKKAVRIAGPTAYVNPNGKNIAPYWNWEDGAHYINDAYNALVTDNKLNEGAYCVLVTNGTHYIKGTLLSVSTPVEIKSVNGAEVTIIEAHGADDPATQEKAALRRIIKIDHEAAVLDGFTLTDAINNTSVGATGDLNLGTMKNCLIKGNKTTGNTRGATAGIKMSGGRIENCVFTANEADYAYQNDALVMTGGVVTDCIFTNSLSCNWWGVVSVGGGVLTNAVIANNAPPGFPDGAQLGTTATGLKLEGGTVVNCIITNNTALSSQGARSAGVYMTSGTLRGCYISGNNTAVYKGGSTSTLYICHGAGLYQEGGTVENCTIINNGLEMGTGHGVSIKSGKAFRNNIVAGNGLTNLFFEAEAATNIVTTSCIYPGEVGDATYGNGPYVSALTAEGKGNKFEDPKLLDNGTPRLSSPCVNAGAYQPWMNGAFDLFGTKRIRGKSVDIGALECAKSVGTMIILK